MRSTRTVGGSYHNLAALSENTHSNADLAGGGPLNRLAWEHSRQQAEAEARNVKERVIVVANHLPVKSKKSESGGWEFELDEDALLVQAKPALADMEGRDVLFVGTLGHEVELEQQDSVTTLLRDSCGCVPVYISQELRQKYYQGFCKQQLWPLLHYVLPMSPYSAGRFNTEMWQAYVRANMEFCSVLTEILNVDSDFVWIHDYHLLVLPSLLRKRACFHGIKCGLFLHSPFPSSEIFRAFPKRDEVLRSLLNADLIGFHTFDYGRHFLSCCSRLLGLSHETSRGSIILEYHGRRVGIKIMPTGIQPSRMLDAFHLPDTKWRQGELLDALQGKTVLVANDDMDTFKGIELKLLAMERVLTFHDEWRGKLVLVQITHPPRSSSRDLTELHTYVRNLVEHINARFGDEEYTPVMYLERSVPRHELSAFYSIADVAVVTATRDGMNLCPYEYIACRQGPDDSPGARSSMLVVSEFVGCSPSLSGAIRVNPWSICSVADGIYSAIQMPEQDRKLRHKKHWKYVSEHTVSFWASSYMRDLRTRTAAHASMQVYPLGLGLDTFRLVAMDANFRRLDPSLLTQAYSSARSRLIMLDYDGTLTQSGAIDSTPSEEVTSVLRRLSEVPTNSLYVISGRSRGELTTWFESVPSLGLAAEHGYWTRAPNSSEWQCSAVTDETLPWMEVAEPILKLYSESTDGSHVEVKESALVWHYRNADPDFGHWQAKELLDHLDSVLLKPYEGVEVVAGHMIVEVKPRGVSKGQVAEKLIASCTPDFVLCIGDDRSDEDMFSAVDNVTFSPHMPAEVFPCTVGQKPSRAKFYLNDTTDVLASLVRLVETDAASQSVALRAEDAARVREDGESDSAEMELSK